MRHTTNLALLFGGTFAGLAAAAALASRFGGATGAGVLAGYTVGAAISVAGVLWQRRLLAAGSRRVFDAFVLAFLAKLVLLTAGALCLRFFEPAAAFADWTSFLVAFPVAVLWVSTLGSLGSLRVLREGRAA